MDALFEDLRHAIRSFLKRPGFAVIAILSLGLGIGSNAAIFGLMDRVLLRSLAVRNPQELVALTATDPRNGSVLTNYDSDYTFSYPMYLNFRDGNPVFDGVIAWFSISANLSLKGQTEVVNAVLVSGNFFDVLGVPAVLGRSFTAGEDRVSGDSPFVVLGYAFWVRQFGADRGVLKERPPAEAAPAPEARRGLRSWWRSRRQRPDYGHWKQSLGRRSTKSASINV
jgi:hypothetical protein